MNHKFKLSENFLSKYEGKQPDWGFGPLSYFVYKRTYSRIKEDGIQEEFFDTVKRCVEGSFSIQLNHCKNSHLPWDAHRAQRSAQVMFEKMWNFKFLPPGRGMWIMGTPILEKLGSTPLLNCGFTSTKDINKDFAEPFAWACDMLMLGVGIGYDTLGAGKVLIKKPDPVVVIPGVNTYDIPDTREGWIESVRKLLQGYTSGNYWMFNYNLIRPAGTPIKGFGGTASGPDPLREGLESIRKLLDSYDGKYLDSVGIVDIFNFIGKFVVAGNVRRSAEIAIGNIDDDPFITMKDYKLYPEELKDRRWMSNNSVVATASSDYDRIIRNISLNGEPGIILLDNARHYGRFKDGYYTEDHPRFDRVAGFNPCTTKDTWVMTLDGPKQVKNLIGNKEYTKKYLVDSKVYDGTSFYSTGIKQTYLLKTKEGYSVKLTDNHKVLTTDGWKEAKDLLKDDSIILNNHRTFDGNTWGNWDGEEDNGYLLGHLIGDGTFSENRAVLAVWLQEGEQSVIDHINNICEKFNTRSDFNGFNKVTTINSIDQFRLSCKALTNLAMSYGVVQGNKTITDKIEESSAQFHRGFLAGLFDTDGSVQGTQEKGISIRLTNVDINILERAQRMLLRFGIVSSIYLRKEATEKLLPDGKKGHKLYPCKDLYELIISNDSIHEFYNNISIRNSSKIAKLEEKISAYSRNPNRSKFICTFSELIPSSIEEVYDVTVKDVHRFDGNGLMLHNCAEQSLESYECCNLVETFVANHDTVEEYLDTLKYAYLYAKSVTLLPTHCEKTNQIMLQNRRIGCSQSGVQQAIKKFGIQTYLSQFCDKGYNTVSYWDNIYSRWLGIPTSKRTTTIKPSGCRPKDSMITTSQGIFTLEEILKDHPIEKEWNSIEDLKALGVNKNITKTYRNGISSIIKIKTRYNIEVESTPNHQWFVVGHHNDHSTDYSKNGWKRADELKLGDVLDININSYNGEPKVLNHVECPSSITNNRGVKLGKQPLVMDNDLSWLIGYLWGDGALSPSKYRIRFIDENIYNLEKAKSILETKFAITIPDIIKLEDRNAYSLEYGSHHLWNWVIENGFYKYNDDNTLAIIPKTIRSSSKQNIISFIAGLIDSDGCISYRNSKRNISIATAYDKFANNLQHIALSCGLIFGRSLNSKGENLQKEKHIWLMNLAQGSDRESLNCLIANSNKCQESIKNDFSSVWSFYEKGVNSYVLGKVTAIEELEEEKETFDVEVADEHWYYAGAIKSHNTISLLAGATPGVHCTHSEYYLRTIRVAANSELIPILKKANFRIETSVTDPKTLVVYFPVKEKNFTKSKYDISLWEQLTLVKELQYYWSDNSVSCTITFKPEEIKDLKSAIEYFSPYVKTLSFLPLEDHNYEQAPYQTITKEQYDSYVSTLEELDFSKSSEKAKGEKYCTNDSCSLV